MMIYLAGGGLPVLQPTLGLLFWMTLIFAITWMILGKFAFKPIANALRQRENTISDALKSAERARAEVAELKNENEELLKQAREERSQILKEANDIKVQTIAEAKAEAKIEADKMLENARIEIGNQKAKAMADVKSEVGAIATEIAEKLMKKNLSGTQEHQDLIASLVKDAKLN